MIYFDILENKKKHSYSFQFLETNNEIRNLIKLKYRFNDNY